MLPGYFQSHDKDIVDMDTKERIRYMSESSMSGTSGYSTTSPGPGNSPSSTYSPVHSPASVLQAEFSNLALPTTATQHNAYQQLQQPHSPQQYLQLQNVSSLNQPIYNNNSSVAAVNYSFGNLEATTGNTTTAMPINYQQPTSTSTSYMTVKREYPATIRISEQPVEKFRFRYKSEMHGTHGSLNGTSSQRNTKSFPEIELSGYTGPAIIRCSLFQTNRDSPHSHQLVVRKDDHDICDPHELKVSKDLGYYAEFKNMGIIHTAKKFIVEELLKKKRKRLHFELGRDDLTTKEEQELFKQTEKEAKDMNLNQVRLCFEAFRVENNNLYTPIAAPVYSNPINNRKSAQTGELRITRLSIATGSVSGGEDLILLVEKVSKKNIKVRFFEMNEDEQVWEAFASFRESDVHHQYAIVCRTPAYRDKEIDKTAEVFIELVRPSDDERSYPPVSFRYKPRDAVISRKRRRTCSTMSGSSGSNSGSLSSGEIPKTIQEQQQHQQQSAGLQFSKNLSEEIDRLFNNPEFKQKCKDFSEEGIYNYTDILDILENDTKMNCDIQVDNIGGRTEKDGAATHSGEGTKSLLHYKKLMISKKLMDTARQQEKQQQQNNSPAQFGQTPNRHMQSILKIYVNAKSRGSSNADLLKQGAEEISKIVHEHSDLNGESLIHEMVVNDNSKYAMHLCRILEYFKLEQLFNTILNNRNQTALHVACLYDRSQYIRPLLSLGCNPNAQDAKGDTALHITVRERHTRCFECFIKSHKELKLNLRNDDGFTPLHLAIRDNNYEMASKLILHDKAVASVPNSIDGNNALHSVIQQQNLELVKLILENQSLGESLLHAQNTAGYTPLDFARQLANTSKQSGEILSILQTFNNISSKSSSSSPTVIPFSDMDDICPSALIIKEEEPSSSSTEDEEEDSLEPMVTIPAPEKKTPENSDNYAMDIQIKSENDEEEYFNATELEMALEDKDIFLKICEVLNANDRWKQTMKIPSFYLTQSEHMLNYVKRNIKAINCHSFALTLQEIDNKLIELIKK